MTRILRNRHAAKLVTQTAKKTVPGRPFLDLPEDDWWHVHNAVLNAVAELFAEGVVAEDLGLPVAKGHYVFAMTCEKEGGVKAQKVRILMIREDALLNKIPPEEMELPDGYFEEVHHRIRIDTLRRMRDAHLAQQKGGPPRTMRCELTVPALKVMIPKTALQHLASQVER